MSFGSVHFTCTVPNDNHPLAATPTERLVVEEKDLFSVIG